MFSSLDDRYQNLTNPLHPFVGEKSLMKYRLKVEIDYFIWMAKDKFDLSENIKKDLIDLYENFSQTDFELVKSYEIKTKHDVKALEYFLRYKLEPYNVSSKITELIHFGLTSQDINTSAIALQLSSLLEINFTQQLKIINILETLASENKDTIMMARTHGQPAIPTTLGKELMVFVNRFNHHLKMCKTNKCNGIATKFGGAVGNLNAHYLIDPDKDWNKDFDDFIKEMSNGNLYRVSSTTQILPYDYWNWIFDYLRDFHLVMKDLCQDVWLYISFNYFDQEIDKNQVGSSAMPQKINPIDFENCEGNCDLVEMWTSFLSRKLTISRLQRDLTDSTVLRNIYQPFGYSYVALKSLEKGLLKLKVNREVITKDLESHPTILSEAFQTILRDAGCQNPYETVRKITQGNTLTLDDLKSNILNSYDNLTTHTIDKIKNINFNSYIGHI
jgi:adenylosuccinate lyase